MYLLRRYPALVLSVIVLGTVFVGCEAVTEPDQLQPPRELSSQEREVLSSNQEFGINLFKALHEAEPDENLFISPLSASLALGMALNGADGDTYEAMKETLALAGLSEAEINDAYRDLMELLVNLDRSVTFDIANSIWYRNTFSVEDDFLEANRIYFDAKVEALDFSSPDAVDIINAWVAEKTNDLLDEIVEQIDPLTMMYLINAIYFQADWRYQFDPADTEPEPFTRLDGSEVAVDMMKQETDLLYLQTETFRAVDLPYGDSLFSMTVFLPHEDSDVHELMEELDGAAWESWTDGFEPMGIRMELPKFTLEWESSLKSMLKAMGMEPAFDPRQSDFSRINPGADDLHISEVKQKTFLEIDEEGTEAAAVTKVVISLTSANGGGPIPFRVDRPFILTIREHHSNTLLFIGKILDPTAL